MNKNLKRKIIQLFMGVFFVFLMVGGYFYPYLGFVVILMMITLLVISIFKNRLWCGWICPRGSFLERYLSFFSLSRSTPKFLKTNLFRWSVVGFMFVLLFIQLWFTGGNLLKIGATFMRLCIATTLVALPLGVIFKPRTWCMFCPMATVQKSLYSFSRFSKEKMGKK
jgi:ferredoxin-type protein NapH